MKDDKLIPLLLLMAGILISIAGIVIFVLGNYLAGVL
jgi:hypothetical protein